MCGLNSMTGSKLNINNTVEPDYPLVSIIIPNFNRVHLIGETLDSLLRQSYSNWEAIVVDDRSTDTSLLVIEEYVKKDSRIRFFIRSREPKGAPTCRNI